MDISIKTVVFALGLVVGIACLAACRKSSESKPAPGPVESSRPNPYELDPAKLNVMNGAMAQDRVAKILPSGPSENARDTLGAPPASSPPTAGSAAKRDPQKLIRLKKLLENAQVEIVLHAAPGKPFGAREVWDAMYSMGLQWGDMDLFHWGSPDLGGDRFFSVETTTEPGYFLPEDAAAHKHFEGLVFALMIPSTREPARVAEAMLRGAKYAQGRLGGSLTMGDGAQLDDAAVLGSVRRSVKAMLEAGVTPGSEEVDDLF